MAIGTPYGERRAGPGAVMFEPRDVPFNWRNAGPGPLRYFALYMPAGFEQFFRDASAAVEKAGGMPPLPVQLGHLMMPLWRQYGVSQLA
jgi:hypothetical protein